VVLMSDVIVKRPTDIVTVRFDFREFVTRVVAEGVAVEDVSYTLRAQAGVTISASLVDNAGLLDVVVSGGAIGVVYDYGIEAKTPEGDSSVDVRKVRVRDPSLFPVLPTTGETVLGTFHLVTDTGDDLVTEAGDFLIWG
jgi:hypothetical protein